jgi:hypothetical protein
MKKNQAKPKTEQAQDVQADEEIERIIYNNKDDSIEDTFCYRLFEDYIFDENLCEKLCINIEKYTGKNQDMKNVMQWIIDCVNQCFYSHHDDSDFFEIKNFKNTMEEKWNSKWMKIISNKINS